MIQWIQENWQTVTAGAGAVVMLARIIVKLTPSPKDDTILQKVVDFLKTLGLHLG